MSSRRTVLLIVLAGLCAALLSIGLNLVSSETIDWLREQAWYNPHGLWAAVVIVAILGIAIAIQQFSVARKPAQVPWPAGPVPPASRPRIAFLDWGEIPEDHPVPIRSGQTGF